MKKLLLLIFCIGLRAGLTANDPDTLYLENCLQTASERSLLVQQKVISEQLLNRRLQNIRTNWYPAVGFNAQAMYNSETIEFAELMEGVPVSIPSLPLDQYKIWAEINQQIYDGGAIKAGREIEKSGYKTEIYQTESELLALRLQVSQVFFSLLLAQNNSDIILSSMNLLTARKDAVQAGVNNGTILPENLLAIEAEIIALRQKLTEIRLGMNQLLKVLSLLTDSSLRENMVMAVPGDPSPDENGIRPEFMLFSQQKKKLDLNQKVIKAGDMPRIFAFSQLAYGRPGFNMVSRDFHGFYTVGAGLKWNFINYGDTKRQYKILELQKDQVDIKQNNFDEQLQIQLESELTNIIKYDSLMNLDVQILALRSSIAESSLSRLNNGVITSADYIEDMNAEMVARLQHQTHKILKKQAQYNYFLLQGKLKY